MSLKKHGKTIYKITNESTQVIRGVRHKIITVICTECNSEKSFKDVIYEGCRRCQRKRRRLKKLQKKHKANVTIANIPLEELVKLEKKLKLKNMSKAKIDKDVNNQIDITFRSNEKQNKQNRKRTG